MVCLFFSSYPVAVLLVIKPGLRFMYFFVAPSRVWVYSWSQVTKGVSTMATRTRSHKVHAWAQPEIMLRFIALCDRLGLSRDGGLERAMLMLLKKHEGAK